MRRSTQTLGSLQSHIIDVGSGPPKILVVLCHGYGAPGNNLVGLAEELMASAGVTDAVRFVFPQGPLDLAAMHMPGARAWWHLDAAMLHLRLQRPEEFALALRQQSYPGLPAARKMLHRAVNEALASSGLGFAQLILGGFSQGAMLTTELALRLDEPPAALFILSGTLIDQDNWRRLMAQRSGLEVVQSHGRSDAVLPFDNAEALHEMLVSQGCRVHFVPFAGGHEISGEAVRQCGAVIATTMANV